MLDFTSTEPVVEITEKSVTTGLLDGETLSVCMEEFRREMLYLSVKQGEGFVMVGAGFRPVKNLSK